MEGPGNAFPAPFARPAPTRVEVLDPQGERIMNAFFDFLQTCQQERDPMAEPNEENVSSQEGELRELEYVMQLKEMKEYGKSTLFVDFTRLLHANHQLAGVILEEYFRFEPYLRRAVQKLVQVHQPSYLHEEGRPKEFYVAFYNMAIVHKLRDLKTELLGQLASVSGVVVRTSEVRPELLYGTFRCLECGHVQRNVEQQFKYTQPIICTNSACSNRERWALERTECQFVDWQRVRLQENSDEVPAGSLPRTLDVILRHETVEQARPGDKCVFTGTLVVVPDVAALARSGERQESVRASGERGSGGAGGDAERGRGGSAPEGMRGLRALGVRDLNYRMAFLASAVQSSDRDKQLVNIRAEEESDAAALEAFTAEEKEEIARMGIGGNIYERLVSSVAPSVFGHHDIKRAILLMLFGGVHKRTEEGINLRGDINVCIVGDPSCAKSQFLKYVASFLPRAVYTSGKSSSAAGLTATVAKEPETGEFCIEAGALMLADNGICCIDEFDKMDVKDQVAIHEAMEQQTISIAKAGIQATLNARTSILAAANPTGGRYDKSKPLKYNVALPPAILSRFDLVHVMVDTPDVTQDYSVARHIVSVHQSRDAAIHPEFTTLQLQKYIKYARAIKPEIAPDARVALTEAYVSLRRGDAAPGSHAAYRITVRQLEALIRLSEALARLHLEDEVRPRHVREAKRLLSTSIISVESQDVALDDEEEEEDPLDGLGGIGGGANGRGPGPDGGREGAGNGAPNGSQGNGHAGSGAQNREGMDVDSEPEAEGEAGAGADGAPAAGVELGEDAGPVSQPEEGEGEGTQGPTPSQARAAGGGTGGGAPGAGPGQRTTIPLGKLEQVTTALVMRLRRHEEEAAAAETEGTEGQPMAAGVGMRQGDLVRWFVAQQNEAGGFDSIQELLNEYRLVRRIIQHLISREGTLILLGDGTDDAEVEAQDTTALLPQELEAQRATAVDRRILAVNPNYVLE